MELRTCIVCVLSLMLASCSIGNDDYKQFQEKRDELSENWLDQRVAIGDVVLQFNQEQFDLLSYSDQKQIVLNGIVREDSLKIPWEALGIEEKVWAYVSIQRLPHYKHSWPKLKDALTEYDVATQESSIPGFVFAEVPGLIDESHWSETHTFFETPIAIHLSKKEHSITRGDTVEKFGRRVNASLTINRGVSANIQFHTVDVDLPAITSLIADIEHGLKTLIIEETPF